MFNFINSNKWKKWYPNFIKTDSKNIKKKIIFKKSDIFFRKNQKHIFVDKDLYQKVYNAGFQEGYQSGWLQSFLFFAEKKNKIKEGFIKWRLIKFLKCFELSYENFNRNISSRILKTTLKISKIIIGDILKFHKDLIIEKINKIFNKTKIVLKNPIVCINPKNQELVQKNFGEIFKIYGWTVVLKSNIDIYSCYIISKGCEIDATVATCFEKIQDFFLSVHHDI